MTWEKMVFIFKTHPFCMSFQEIREMTFKQAMLMIEELKNSRTEKMEAVQSTLKRSKDIMPMFDVTRGIYD